MQTDLCTQTTDDSEGSSLNTITGQPATNMSDESLIWADGLRGFANETRTAISQAMDISITGDALTDHRYRRPP
jgi:hypothetical protein